MTAPRRPDCSNASPARNLAPTVTPTSQLQQFAALIHAGPCSSPAELHRLAATFHLRATTAPVGENADAGWVVLTEAIPAEPDASTAPPKDLTLGLIVVPANCQPGSAVLFTHHRAN